MRLFIYIVLIIIFASVFALSTLEIIDIITRKDDEYYGEDSGDCPNCKHGKIYSNWHGDNYLEYRCDACDYMLIYEKVDGKWKCVTKS